MEFETTINEKVLYRVKYEFEMNTPYALNKFYEMRNKAYNQFEAFVHNNMICELIYKRPNDAYYTVIVDKPGAALLKAVFGNVPDIKLSITEQIL